MIFPPVLITTLSRATDIAHSMVKEYGMSERGILINYLWPGNIRELENAMEHAFVLADGPIIEIKHLPPELRHADKNGTPPPPPERDLNKEEENIKRALLAAKGHLRRGEIVPVIIGVAEEKSADLIVLGASHGEIVAEWMNARAMERTDIPVLLIPKWVPAAKRSSPKG